MVADCNEQEAAALIPIKDGITMSERTPALSMTPSTLELRSLVRKELGAAL